MQLELPFLRAAPEPRERVHFVRVRGARRYILRMRPDGTLRVTLPRWGSKREAKAFVASERHWIERERRRVLAEHGPREWDDGSTILFRGEPVRVSVSRDGVTCTVRYADRQVIVPPGTAVRTALEQDLRAAARVELVRRLHELASAHQLEVARVTVRNQRSRWGSCSRAGIIALNFRLLQMPREVCDYVMLHELMHLREQNHSRRFWRLVEAACPAFREAERWLKVQGKALF